jgi:hypothetical protein
MGRFAFALVATLVLTLGSTAFGVDIDAKAGAIQFSGPSNKGVKIKLGKRLKFEPEFKYIQIGKGNAVNVGGGDVENTTDKKIFYSYHVAFFDKDKNVIGVQNFSLWIDAGKKARIGTFIALPPEQIAKITSYSAIFYEDDEQIGNK